MNRKVFAVELVNTAGEVVSQDVAYAMNSAIRKSEALARDLARNHGVMLAGHAPSREGNHYRREWSAPGVLVTAHAREVLS